MEKFDQNHSSFCSTFAWEDQESSKEFDP